MFEGVLRVKYISLKTCFIYLSPAHKNLSTGVCLKLSYSDNRSAYFSTTIIRNIVAADCIGINSAYAAALEIKEDEFVNVSQIGQLPIVNSIHVHPFNKADYEVLELLALNIQSNLLEQVRVIKASQKIVIWIGNNISVIVFVEKVEPVSMGMLDFLTEVVIKPPNLISYKKCLDQENETQERSQYMSAFLQFLNKTSQRSCLDELKNVSRLEEDLYFRLIPLSELPGIRNKLKLSQPFKAFTFREGPYKYIFETNVKLFYKMTLLDNCFNTKNVYMEICFLEDVLDELDPEFMDNSLCNIFVDDSVLSFMNCNFGARVVLEAIKCKPNISEMEIQHGTVNSSKEVLEKLKIYLGNNSGECQVLNANFPLKIDENLYCLLKFTSECSEFCVVDGDLIRNCSFSFRLEDVKPLEEITKVQQYKQDLCLEISQVEKISKSVLFTLCKYGKFQADNIILTGKSGMGKTTLLKHFSSIFSKYPYFIYTEIVECKMIKGKTVESLHKVFTDLFAKLILYQPSLLIIDDLHTLCESCEGEETQNTIYIKRVSEMLCNLLFTIRKHNLISILASAESVSKLNKNIYQSRGRHLFKNVFAIEDLTRKEKVLLLKYFFSRHSCSADIDFSDLALKTDGFVVQDIKDFYRKALFEAHKEPQDDNTLIITQDHCDKALKKTCALALQNIKFHSVENKSFNDVGGLKEVKTVLIESFLWPIKYTSIFANSPLRLQFGLLLYGPPGTGKSLIAAAAAKECSLRLILVKGPELLSKYIGASEQAVRDVFEKAQRAKPCILFFDEFDSLAPRRGHDNTGVTDRVVNQLLTQLDGVESLTGVCVLAATSRPDLLDPALLRPGRLDKQLLCSMPNQHDRLEILEVLSKKLELAEDVDFNELALQTEGYSGADLQAILFTAQISSLKLVDHETDIVKTKLKQADFLAALSKTRPSLTRSEKLKYERIYSKFQKGQSDDYMTGSKVTLA